MSGEVSIDPAAVRTIAGELRTHASALEGLAGGLACPALPGAGYLVVEAVSRLESQERRLRGEVAASLRNRGAHLDERTTVVQGLDRFAR